MRLDRIFFLCPILQIHKVTTSGLICLVFFSLFRVFHPWYFSQVRHRSFTLTLKAEDHKVCGLKLHLSILHQLDPGVLDISSFFQSYHHWMHIFMSVNLFNVIFLSWANKASRCCHINNLPFSFPMVLDSAAMRHNVVLCQLLRADCDRRGCDGKK